jgi:hypothetical protein
MIENVHFRALQGDPGPLLDRMDTELWPSGWPALEFDRPLGVGADGGHGPIRYTCTDYVPGKRVEFTFAPSLGLIGTHTLEVVPGGLRHTAVGRPTGRMRVLWPFAIRWLHDALIEDLLDNAETALGTPPARPARWSPWVRVLRRLRGRHPLAESRR